MVKTKKLFFSASERPRTVLNAFLECMYFDKMTVKTKKLFFLASERPRTVLNAFLECMYLAKLIWIESTRSNQLDSMGLDRIDAIGSNRSIESNRSDRFDCRNGFVDKF